MRHSIIPVLFAVLGSATSLASQQAVPSSDSIGLPLTPTRTLRFTTDEGTWMSLDVSPDGSTIVFDLLGDLYTLPITGGGATRITDGIAFDSQPRFSPDGRQIVFVSDRSGDDEVWIGSAEGTELRQLTNGAVRVTSPEWTPDGEGIIAEASGSQLFYFDLNGGKGLQITTDSGQDRRFFRDPAFGKDGQYIYATVSVPASPFNPVLDRQGWQLAKVDRQTGRARRITDLWGGGGLRPVASPDGRWLVYATRLDTLTALRLHETETGDERWLGIAVDRDVQEYPGRLGLLPGASFTPDSRALIITYGGKIHRVEVPSGQASEIPFSADVELHLGAISSAEHTIEDSALTVRQIRGARVSPDGARLVFTALDRLWTMQLPDGVPTRLTTMDVGEHSPVWSPDGRNISYVTWADTLGGHVYQVSADGRGEPRALTPSPAFYDQPAYAPGGERIIALRGPRNLRIHAASNHSLDKVEDLELVWIPATGGEATVIAQVETIEGWTNSPTELRPHFGQDPERIFLNHHEHGLVSIRYDGTDQRFVLRAPGDLGWGGVRSAVISPDERHAVIGLGGHLYLVELPRFSKPITLALDNPAASPVPAMKITDVGGEFPSWSGDGKTLYYSFANAFFAYDVARADSLTRVSSRSEAEDTTATAPEYEPLRRDIIVHVPKSRPEGTVVLRGARVITLKGDDVFESGDVVVVGNRIAAAGPRGQVEIPSGAHIIDATGKTILPGWVDVHAHMAPAPGVHRSQPWEYLAQLAYGVTTTRDPQTFNFDGASYADMVEAGLMVGPRTLMTGPGILYTAALDTREKVRDYLRRYSEFYRTGTIKNYLAGNRKVRQWLITEAIAQGLHATAEGVGDFKLNLTYAIDGFSGQEHNYTPVPIYRDVIELIAFSGLTYTPTLMVTYSGPSGKKHFFHNANPHDDPKLRHFIPHEELDRLTLRDSEWSREDQYIFRQVAAQAAKIVAAGGRVGLGAHGELQGLGTIWELVAMAEGGMPLHDVLRVGTVYGAESIGLGKELGSIETGKLADLQVLDENPLEDIWNTLAIRYVMKNGILYDANTLDEVWPDRKSLPRQWWWSETQWP